MMDGIIAFIGDVGILVGKKSEFPTKEDFIYELGKDWTSIENPYSVDDVKECNVAYRLNQDILDGEDGYIAYFNGVKPRGSFPCWYVEER